MAACVPKPEEIKGCGSGMEFNETIKSCVALASVNLDTTFTALAATEDVPESFSLPNATTDSVEGTLYWFITKLPTRGTLTGCANLDVDGEMTSVGTVLRSCIYTSDSNWVGPDSFAYKICGNTAGTKNCIAPVTVAVTVADDQADIPVLNGPSVLNINEGSSFNYDVRVSRVTKDEDDPFYICVDVIDPDSALNVPAMANVNEPGDPITINDANCSLLGSEDDNLAAVLGTFSSGTNLLPGSASKTAYIMMRLCESATCTVGGIDGIDNDTDGEIDEEDEWSAADLANVAVIRSRVNVNDLSFAPVMATATPPLSPKALAAEVEDAVAMVTIGTDTGVGVNDRVLEPRATDGDGDAITYELVPLTFFPAHAGTLLCVSGAELACTFSPAANFSGTISFRYRARDATNKLSGEISVSMVFTAVNDPPEFLASQVMDYDTATPATQVALQENRTLADRTFKVGEGGGVTENTQTLVLRATSSDPTILAPSGIRVKRGATSLGVLSDTTGLVLDSPAMDADAASYTLSFTPASLVLVTDSPVTITLELSDGIDTTTQDITFLGVHNLNDTITALTPATFGMKSGGVTKDLEFIASPGTNDWAAVTGGGQSLTVTITSSNTAVVNLSTSNLSTTGGGITPVQQAGCVAASCSYIISYDGSNLPNDDIMNLSLISGIRGNSTLTFTFSDGVSPNVVKTVAVGSYTFAVSFNGWNFLSATGIKTTSIGTKVSEASVVPAWDGLTVTEGGLQTSAYKVLVYRKSTSDFSSYPATPLREAGVPSTQSNFLIQGGVTYDDGSTLAAGERFYLAVAVVPNALGEPIYPPSVVDTAIEVVVPPDNMALVHRWSSNRVYCSLTGQTPDRNNNYRCNNVGLGGVQAGGVWYHDIQDHIFMDTYEAGCPYTGSNIEDGVFISAAGIAGQVHYNRNTGVCSYSDGTSWLPFTDAAYALNPALITSVGNMPPLTGLTRSQAQASCAAEVPQCDEAACPSGVGDVWEGSVRELPTRREMMRANLWPTSVSAANVTLYEDSGNHASPVRACNTNSASGQTYQNIASTALTADTITASAVSTVRSLSNSATATSNCLSLFQLYNTIGNVGEWLADSYSCTSASATHSSCDMLSPVGTQAGGLKDASLGTNNSLGVTYSFDGTAGNGPLLEKDTVVTVSSLFRVDLDRMYAVLGLPFYDDATVPHPSAGLPRIGTSLPPSSYAPAIFSNDKNNLTWATDTSSAATQYAMVQGGDWTSGSGAGRYSYELRQDGQSSGRVGHRCVIRLPASP